MSIETTLDALDSDDVGKRRGAEAALAAEDPGLIPGLLRIASDDKVHANLAEDPARIFCTGCIVFLAVPFGILILFVLALATPFHPLKLLLIPGIAITVLGVVLLPRVRSRRAQLQRRRKLRAMRAKQLLANWSDVRAVAPLCQALKSTYPTTYVPPITRATLTRLLPRLVPGDSNILIAADRERLHSMLRIEIASEHANFVFSILEALEQIGGDDAIPYVQRLADTSVTTLGGARVRAAAIRCLQILEQRRDTERDSKTLLRAAETTDGEILLRPTESTDGILLRPSGGAGSAVPEQLLRSSENSGGQAD